MAYLNFILSNLQTKLVSGTNIKTVNNVSILGAGNISINAGISIGDSVGGGTAGSVLYLGALGVLAQSPTMFNYTDANGLTVSPSGTIVQGFSAGVNVKGAAPTLRVTGSTYGFGNFVDGAIMYFGRTTDNWSSVSFFGGVNLAGNGWGFGDITNPSAIVHAKAKVATDVVSKFKGTNYQTANLTEWQNVSDTVLASVDNDGKVDSVGYKVGGVAGFTGTGDYNSFTIVGGIITNAVEI